MVNQQLKDYISEQVRVGVSRDAIKSALIEAGWAQTEVNEAMGTGATPAATPARVDTVSSAAVAAAKPVSTVSVARPVQPSITVKPITVTVPGAAKSPNIAAFAPKTSGSGPVFAANASASASTSGSGERHHGRHRLVDIAMGILILILGAGAAVFFIKNTGLAKELGLAEQNNSMVTNQVQALTTSATTLRAENATLEADKQALTSELAIFVSPLASGEEQLDIKGTLVSGGDKGPYTLRTSHMVILVIQNSRVPAVDAVLTPLIGTSVQLTFKHKVGSKDVTAVAVNGEALPQATSTTPGR